MYPGPDDPDLGVFVAQIERALAERGHEVERAVLDSRREASGGTRPWRTAPSAPRAASGRTSSTRTSSSPPGSPQASRRARRSSSPPTAATSGTSARSRGSGRSPALTVRRASAVIAVSDYLRRELEAKVPEARGKTEVIDSGVDLDRFRVEPAPPDGPAFLCLGALTERKNVVRLADAFERLGAGTLTFVGDGPLRPQLEGRARVELVPQRRARRDPGEDRERARRLPAEPRRAVRPGPARGARLRPLRRRRPGSAALPSSCRPRPACSSTRSTSTRSPTRSRAPPRSRARTRPPARPPSSTTSRSRPRRVEAVLERAVRAG